jgi:hypothetical protein
MVRAEPAGPAQNQRKLDTIGVGATLFESIKEVLSIMCFVMIRKFTVRVRAMPRTCSTCQHVKRTEIDRRLAAGEPGSQIARDYQLSLSSLHRHRVNCLRLSSSHAIMKEAARGTVALACLPSREELHCAYCDLRARIDQIVKQAEQEGSLKVPISGLNSIRQTLDSLTRLAGYDRPIDTQVNVAVQNNINFNLSTVAERLIKAFDQEPEIKGRIAQALLEMDHEHPA